MHRLLVIGTGSIGERHVRCILSTKRAQVGICEINDQLRRQVAERYGIAQSFSRLEDALQTPWDIALIATPAPSHIPVALQLVEANVNILIEKPLSTTEEGLPELIDKRDRRGVVIGVAYVYRANPILSAMRAALQSGRFGRPMQLVSVAGQHFPLYRPAYREIYYTDRAQGGGAIQDCLTHILNAGEWLVGPIDRLVADAAHQVLEGVEVEDTVNLVCRHGNVMGCYSVNQFQAPNEVTISVICDQGALRFELHESRWRWMMEPGGQWRDEVFPQGQRDDLYITQANAFLDAVEGKADLLCTLEDAAQTLKVNLTALRCVDGGSGWLNVR